MEKHRKMNMITGIITAALIFTMSPTAAVADEDDDFNEADYEGVITIIKDPPVPIAELPELNGEPADGTLTEAAVPGQTEDQATDQAGEQAADQTGEPQETEPQAEPVAPPTKVDLMTDLEKDAWYLEGVCYAVNYGILDGLTDTLYGPEVVTTRGMLVTALYRHAGSPSYNDNAEYADVVAYTDIDRNQYYCGAVSWGTINGIVNGYDNGTFRPNNPVTRQELAVILYRYAKYINMDTSQGNGTDAGCFIDASDISDYAVEAVSWACRNGILSGYEDGAIRPHYSATRAQVAVMLMRFDRLKG